MPPGGGSCQPKTRGDFWAIALKCFSRRVDKKSVTPSPLNFTSFNTSPLIPLAFREKFSLSLSISLSLFLSLSISLSLNVSFYIALLLRCFLYVLIWEKETVKSLGEGEGEKKINLSNYFYEGTFGKKVGQSLVELSRFIHHRNCGFSGELFYYLISTKNRGKAAVEIWNFQAQEEIGPYFFFFHLKNFN